MGQFISDADFEKNIGLADTPKSNFISDADFEKNIGIADESPKPKQTREDLLRQLADETSTGKALVIGAGRGIMDITQGAKQLALKGAEKVGLAKEGASEDYRQKINKELALLRSLEESKPIATTGGRILGGVAATLPAGAIGVGAKVGNAALRAIGTGAAQGATIGALEYDPTGESRLKNMGTGAVLGGAANGLLAGAGAGISRVIKGKNNPKAVAETQLLGQLSKEHGVDLTVPELRGSVGGKYAETLIEKMPFTGYTGFREKQAQQFQNAAENITNKMGGDTAENYGDIIQGSLASTFKHNKNEAKNKFDLVEKIANKQGGKVEFNNTRQEVDNIINELERIPESLRNDGLINQINRFKEIKDLPFNRAREVRSYLGDEVSQLKKSANNGTIKANEYRYASQLFSALEKDIDNFADKSGDLLKNAYKDAQSHYKDKVVPFKKGILSKTLAADKDTDLVVGGFLKPGRANLASQLVKNTDDKGLTAARAAILNTALEKASTGEFFNAQRFAKEALRLGKANKVVFTPEQRHTLEGYSKLAKAAERASKFAANPETGARSVGAMGMLGAGISIARSPTSSIYIIGGLLAPKVMHSEAGRRLFTRAYNLPEKGADKAWAKLLKDATKLVAPVTATQPDIPHITITPNEDK
jgi:hypothetical protein